MLKNLKDWQLRYIELKSQFYDVPSDLECVKLIGKSRQSISNFKRDYPEYKKLIRDNLAKKSHEIGLEAMQGLIKGIKKGNASLIKIALEIDKIYQPTNTNINKYEEMSEEEITKDINNSLKHLLGKNGMIYRDKEGE
jgi:hypothetical protein